METKNKKQYRTPEWQTLKVKPLCIMTGSHGDETEDYKYGNLDEAVFYFADYPAFQIWE